MIRCKQAVARLVITRSWKLALNCFVDYAAPEVLQMDGAYGMEVDMWSVGVITYVLY